MIRDILGAPVPKSLAVLRIFIGLVRLCCRFIRNSVKIFGTIAGCHVRKGVFEMDFRDMSWRVYRSRKLLIFLIWLPICCGNGHIYGGVWRFTGKQEEGWEGALDLSCASYNERALVLVLRRRKRSTSFRVHIAGAICLRTPKITFLFTPITRHWEQRLGKRIRMTGTKVVWFDCRVQFRG